MVSCIHCIPKRTPPEVIDLCQGLEGFFIVHDIHMFGKNSWYISIGCQWSPAFVPVIALVETKMHRGSSWLKEAWLWVKDWKIWTQIRVKQMLLQYIYGSISFMTFPLDIHGPITSRESALLHSWCASHFLWSKVCLALFLVVQNVAKQRWEQKETKWNDMYNSNPRLQILLACEDNSSHALPICFSYMIITYYIVDSVSTTLLQLYYTLAMRSKEAYEESLVKIRFTDAPTLRDGVTFLQSRNKISHCSSPLGLPRA